MAKFIQFGDLRVSVGDIAAYWEYYGNNTGLLLVLLRGGDRFAYEMEKETIKKIAEYLDRQNQVVSFEGKGAWQHAGHLTQEMPGKEVMEDDKTDE